MTTLYTIQGSANPASVDCTEDANLATSTDGTPAGVTVICNMDAIANRAHLLDLFGKLRAAVLADKPLG